MQLTNECRPQYEKLKEGTIEQVQEKEAKQKNLSNQLPKENLRASEEEWHKKDAALADMKFQLQKSHGQFKIRDRTVPTEREDS